MPTISLEPSCLGIEGVSGWELEGLACQNDLLNIEHCRVHPKYHTQATTLKKCFQLSRERGSTDNRTQISYRHSAYGVLTAVND